MVEQPSRPCMVGQEGPARRPRCPALTKATRPCAVDQPAQEGRESRIIGHVEPCPPRRCSCRRRRRCCCTRRGRCWRSRARPASGGCVTLGHADGGFVQMHVGDSRRSAPAAWRCCRGRARRRGPRRQYFGQGGGDIAPIRPAIDDHDRPDAASTSTPCSSPSRPRHAQVAAWRRTTFFSWCRRRRIMSLSPELGVQLVPGKGAAIGKDRDHPVHAGWMPGFGQEGQRLARLQRAADGGGIEAVESQRARSAARRLS